MSNSKVAGIYSITSKVNGKRYIGSSNRICVRWNEHKRELSTNKHENPHLQNHYNKYGKDDLLFAVVEVVERGELSLQDFKNLLLQREQTYLNNWKECQFNCLKLAGSPLGSKHINAKNYCFIEKYNKYLVFYKLFGKSISLGCFSLEQDAKNHVEFIRSLTDNELLKYWEDNHKNKRGKNKDVKNYYYNSKRAIYYTFFIINSKKVQFGSFRNEQDAINEASYLKNLSPEEKLKYYNDNYANGNRKPLSSRKRNTKGYCYVKATNKWSVNFSVNNKTQRYGYFDTEEEARQKAEQVKQELGGFY